jgi:predicted DNA-binding transcriptional regulator AlpA
MAVRMLRPKEAWARVGVGKTKWDNDYVNHGRPGEEFIGHTNIPRLRPVYLGERAIAFLDDEVDELIEALRKHRDAVPRLPARPQAPTARPAHAPRPRARSPEPLVRRPLRRLLTPQPRS